jgi:alkylhydroperoxidase family enzyme
MKAARRVGLDQAKLEGVKGWTTSEAFTPIERAVMAATDEMLARNLIEDATFDALKRYLSDVEIFELLFAVGSFRMHGMIVRALQLECDDDVTTRMRELPEPNAASK